MTMMTMTMTMMTMTIVTESKIEHAAMCTREIWLLIVDDGETEKVGEAERKERKSERGREKVRERE